MGAATPTRLIDNERVRVTEWRFSPDIHRRRLLEKLR